MTVLAAKPTTAPSVDSAMVPYAGPTSASSPYVSLPQRLAIEAAGPAPRWLPELERRVNQLLALGPGWDTYGAQPLLLDHVSMRFACSRR